jgi:hypothetical protein
MREFFNDDRLKQLSDTFQKVALGELAFFGFQSLHNGSGLLYALAAFLALEAIALILFPLET